MITAAQCLQKFGAPGDPKTEGKFISVWNLPADLHAAMPVLPARIYCHRLLQVPLENALRNLMARKLTKELRTWDGCYQVRKKRGASSLSIHSWALAIDLNAAWNAFGKAPTLSPAFVQCFLDAGFDWGGTWSKPDGMHFQLAAI